jgi:hypothetical protein
MLQFSTPEPAVVEIEELKPLSFGGEVEPGIVGTGVEAEAIESFHFESGSLPCDYQAECLAQIDVWEHAITSLGRENSIECLSAIEDPGPEIGADDAPI